MIAAMAELVDQFSDLKTIEKITFVTGLLSLLSLPILSWISVLFRLRSSRKYAADLERVNAALQSQRDHALTEAASEREKAARWIPDAWMTAAKHEREQGNEELAIAALRSGFERVRHGMSHTSLALAGHHLSLIVGTEPLANLAEGERHAQLAALLDPDDADAAFLLEDARAIRAEGQGAVVPVATSFLPSSQEEAAAAIEAILTEAERQVEKGLYRVGVRLVRRARLIAKRSGLTRHRLGLQADLDFAAALHLCGKYAEALDVVTTHLPVSRRAAGESDRLTLGFRVLETSLLEGLGFYPEALEKIRILIPSLDGALGVDHPVALAARTGEVEILISLGEARLALGKITPLLEAHRRTFRERDHQMLLARFLEAQALDQFGDHAEARKRIEPLIEDNRKFLGVDHPSGLTVALLGAEICANLGEYPLALSRMQELLPAYSRALGAEHPFVFIARSQEDRILNELGEHSEALARASSIKAGFERIFGADHTRSLIFRREIVQFRIDSGDVDGVVEEVDEILSRQASFYDPPSKILLSTRLTRASALASLDRDSEATKEIEDVLAILGANYAPTHVLAVRARSLEARLSKP
jgi:tetratricopeptide (TPR) repeat protein